MGSVLAGSFQQKLTVVKKKPTNGQIVRMAQLRPNWEGLNLFNTNFGHPK
jgi:hypothetical protein